MNTCTRCSLVTDERAELGSSLYTMCYDCYLYYKRTYSALVYLGSPSPIQRTTPPVYSRIVIFPYKISSESSKNLTNKLRSKNIPTIRVFPNRKYKYQQGDLVINWGSSEFPQWDSPIWVNNPNSVKVACNKLQFFKRMFESPVIVPQFETRIEIAALRLSEGDWKKCYCRTLLESHSGKGIIVASNQNELVQAELYTEGIVDKDREEYRVHVFNGEVIDFSVKRKKNKERLTESNEVLNRDIRSFNNGWVFCRERVALPDEVRNQAILSVRILGLHFGAVDISYVSSFGSHGSASSTNVFEVNTAPGLEGSTIEKYSNALEKVFYEGLK